MGAIQRTVCLDFNGVIDTYVGWKGEDYFYPPRSGVDEFLTLLRNDGFRIVILTTINTKKVWEWLWKYGLEQLVDDVTNSKPPAVVYVDDRAVCFRGDFVQTLREILDFKAHWEVS